MDWVAFAMLGGCGDQGSDVGRDAGGPEDAEQVDELVDARPVRDHAGLHHRLLEVHAPALGAHAVGDAGPHGVAVVVLEEAVEPVAGDDRVQVVRQDDERVDLERIFAAGACDRVAKRVDMIDEQRLFSIEQIDGEEPASARNEGAAIVGHGAEAITSTNP